MLVEVNHNLVCLSLFCDIQFWMLSNQMHVFVYCLYTFHISSCIVSEFYFLTTTYTFCAPIEISKINWATYFACDSVKTGLPFFYWLTCSLWSKSQMYNLLCFHFLDDTQNHIASPLSVYWNATYLS